ncbi:MAG: hypothetical protein V4503_11055 [Gemmatimonadota bacterium]
MAKEKQVSFKFRRGLNVGQIDATFDTFLRDAFVDVGESSILADTTSPKCIVVGRTGAGKTALLLRLEEIEERVIRIHPDALSLQYLSNSTMLPQMARAGVHLEVFYNLLWRHVFIMELIRARFNLREESGGLSFLEKITTALGANRAEKAALEYYRQWNPKLWETTDVRVREITSTLNERISTDAGIKALGVHIGVGGHSGEDTTQRVQFKERAQAIVNEITMEHMSVGMDLVKRQVLVDKQKPYFILIDDLDRAWVDAAFAYDLIDALVDTAGEFGKLPNVKIVVALREDIVDTIHARFGSLRQQREKHEALFLRLQWTKTQLQSLVDERVKILLRREYGGEVCLATLFPPEHPKHGNAIEYAMVRTFDRPRDIIDFVNKCLEVASEIGAVRLSWSVLLEAERRYSTTRLRSLEDEWLERFPGIGILFEAFRGAKDGFSFAELEDERLTRVCIRGEELESSQPLALPVLAFQMLEIRRPVDIWRMLLPTLVRVGFLGIKVNPSSQTRFSYETFDLASATDTDGAVFYFHPAVYAALGIRDPVRGN